MLLCVLALSVGCPAPPPLDAGGLDSAATDRGSENTDAAGQPDQSATDSAPADRTTAPDQPPPTDAGQPIDGALPTDAAGPTDGGDPPVCPPPGHVCATGCCQWTVEEVGPGHGETAVAVDDEGVIYVAFKQLATDGFSFAVRSTDDWATEEVETSLDPEVYDTGWHVDLELGGDGTAYLAYWGEDFELPRCAARDPGGDWERWTVPDVGGAFVRLDLDSSGRPHLIYQVVGDWARTIVYRYLEGTSWRSAPLSAMDGYDCDLAISDQGKSHVTWWATGDAAEPGLYYQKVDAEAQTAEEIVAIDTSSPEIGEHHALALDAADQPHVVYHGGAAGGLHHAYAADGQWTSEAIDDSPTAGRQNDVVFSADGAMAVAYLDSSTSELTIRRRLSGSWAKSYVPHAAKHTSLAAGDSGLLYLSFVVGDVVYAAFEEP